jgi:ATP-dependent exoDNAse (exonuclease V) alpha subunit
MTQEQALKIMKEGYNVFLTGPPGSGKTYVLNKYISFLKNNEISVAVTASTGIAATHMNGRTIHSWSGLGIKETLSQRDLNKLNSNRRIKKRIKKAEVLIIDEISMMHAYQIDIVDRICREMKGDVRPFGGMQVVFSGDFFQLPPIGGESRESKFITESYVWKEMDIKVCYLSEQYRHKDGKLAEILNKIRRQEVDDLLKKNLLVRNNNKFKNLTKLYTHNVDVDSINEKELDKIKADKYDFYMESKGEDYLVEVLKKGCLAPETLVLKIGAEVMFLKNNFEKGYVNGTLGKVVNFEEKTGYPVVKTFEGKEIVAEPSGWHMEEEDKIKASIYQIPLRLAWAITIHKSQGMTLNQAEIDLGKSFEKGMGYVALSRVRTLEGIILKGLNDVALEVREEAVSLDKYLMIHSKETEELLD